MLPFACYLDPEGNVWMTPGPVIAFHGTTATYDIGTSGLGMVPMTGDVFAPAAGAGAGYQGGNGTNMTFPPTSTPLGTLVPYGKLRATAEDEWTVEGMPNLVLTWDPGDGSAELHDGTDVVATLAAGSPVPRSDTFTATAYGETTYNGGTPWTLDLDYEGAANPFPMRTASVVWTQASTAQAGLWNRTGWQAWESADDPSWTIALDGAGAGEISDGTDVVAERAAIADRPHDPTGEWVPTSYGLATYGDPLDRTTGTPTAGTFPTQDYTLLGTAGAVESWGGSVTVTTWIDLDTGTGDALLKDADGTIAERLGGSLTDIDGTYVATLYGEETYHAAAAFDVAVATASEGRPFLGLSSLARGVPASGVLYAELQIDAVTDEVTGRAGPFWAASLPANTATEIYVPILESNGSGQVTQAQLGPIFWRPRP